MNQAVLKKVGIISTGWLFTALWVITYSIPLCVNQFVGKDCDVTIHTPFLQIQPAASLSIAYLVLIVPLLGFLTGIITAMLCNLMLWLCGGIKLGIEITKSEPEPSADGNGRP